MRSPDRLERLSNSQSRGTGLPSYTTTPSSAAAERPGRRDEQHAVLFLERLRSKNRWELGMLHRDRCGQSLTGPPSIVNDFPDLQPVRQRRKGKVDRTVLTPFDRTQKCICCTHQYKIEPSGISLRTPQAETIEVQKRDQMKMAEWCRGCIPSQSQ